MLLVDSLLVRLGVVVYRIDVCHDDLSRTLVVWSGRKGWWDQLGVIEYHDGDFLSVLGDLETIIPIMEKGATT